MIEYKNTKNFIGNTLTITNGFLQMEIAKDIGPRILSFGEIGGDNLFFDDINDEINKDVSHIYGKGEKWHIYGGHRLWLSPESDVTYYPDNKPVKIQKIPNGVIIKADKQDVTDIKLSVKVEFIKDNEVKITHNAKNLGGKKKLCLWGLTVMKSGYNMSVELDKKDKGLLPNRNLVFWPYDDIYDKRFQIENSYINLRSDKRISKPFKIGTYNDNIKAVYNTGKYIFEKQFEGDCEGDYPDFHCNFECYVSDKIHEIESLSSQREIDTNGEIESIEIWKLTKVEK